jgi:hypothetical protein
MIQESDASVPANEPHNANCSLHDIAGRKLGSLLNQDFAGDAHDDDKVLKENQRVSITAFEEVIFCMY